MSLLRSSLIAVSLLAAVPAVAQTEPAAPSWYGREIAATAVPIRTVEGAWHRDVAPTAPSRDRRERDRTRYYLPYGVTVWAGDFPYAKPVGPGGYVVPEPAREADVPSHAQSVRTPCAIPSGPATAASSIAAAPGAFRSGC